jgi:hypothetical protein
MSDPDDTDVVIRSERQARAERPPRTDGELVATTATVTSAVANLRAITAAREAIRRQFPQRPRAMHFSEAQLAEAYRRAGLRNPRARADTTNVRTLEPI